MTNGKRILVPIDLEANSLDGVEFVAGLGTDMSVLATLLSVVHLNISAPEGRVYDELIREREQRLQSLANTLFENGSARVRVRFGNPHEQILAEARDAQAELIVMPGRKSRAGNWWPSRATTTEKIVRDAPCLTLVIPRCWKISPREYRRSERPAESTTSHPEYSFA